MVFLVYKKCLFSLYCGPALISEYKSMPLLLNIRACPYLRLQGHALLSEQAFQFEPFQNLKFSVIRACPLMRGNTVKLFKVDFTRETPRKTAHV